MKADYGIDDPRVPAFLALAGLVALVVAVAGVGLGIAGLWVSFGITAVSCLGGAAPYMYATLRGKSYPAELDSAGAAHPSIRDLGPGTWFGNPHPPGHGEQA